MLGPISVIAANTVREAVRNKVLFVLLFFALVMIGAGVLVATLSYVERDRILQDVGLQSIRAFGAAIAIFLGVGLIHREVDRRTVYAILAKPVSRTQFLLGKFAGLVATLWLQVAIMGIGFAVVSLLTDAPLNAGHLWAILLTAMELAVVVAFATLFSSFTSPFLATSFSAGLYLVGHLTRDLLAIGELAGSSAVTEGTRWVHRLFPDLAAFNRVQEAIHGLEIPVPEVAWALTMGVAWVVGFLSVAVLAFGRRDFR